MVHCLPRLAFSYYWPAVSSEIKKRYRPRGAIDLFGTREASDTILLLIVPKPILRVPECVPKVGSIFRGIVTIGFGHAQLQEDPILPRHETCSNRSWGQETGLSQGGG